MDYRVPQEQGVEFQVALSNTKRLHFKCRNILNKLDGEVGFVNQILRSKVISLRHTDAAVNSFDDLVNVRNNYMHASIGLYVETNIEKALIQTAQINPLYKGYPELQSLANNNNLDFVPYFYV